MAFKGGVSNQVVTLTINLYLYLPVKCGHRSFFFNNQFVILTFELTPTYMLAISQLAGPTGEQNHHLARSISATRVKNDDITATMKFHVDIINHDFKIRKYMKYKN